MDMLHMSVDGRVGQLTWTTLVERDSHSKFHSEWEELVVTQCQFMTCWLPPLLYCPLCVTTVSAHDTPNFLVQTLNVPSLSLGLLSAPQSLHMFLLTLAPLAQCIHYHFVMQARALRVPELDDHTLHHAWLRTHLRSWGIGL